MGRPPQGGVRAGHREEVLEGLGGISHYFGSFRSGTGGAKVGVGGLQKAQVQELIDLVVKRHKFLKAKEQAVLAVLDMRARLAAAGL